MGAWDYKAYGSAEQPIHQSHLGTFNRCPKLLVFRMEEEHGVRFLERKVHGLPVSGTAAHEVLRRALPYAVEGRPVNLTHVRAAYFEELDRACEAEGIGRTGLTWSRGQKPDDHYRLKIAGLFHFLSVAPKSIASVEAVETVFRTVLRHGKREMHAEGTWDIVFRTHEGRLALADYKSGLRRPSAFSNNFGYQLGLYADGILNGEAADGRRFAEWPEEIWIVMTQDFLPARKDSSRKVWTRDEAEFFRVRPGQTVRIRKGAQRGPGWYRAERSPTEGPALAEAVWSVVAAIRSGNHPRRWDDDCQRCSFKVPCVQQATGAKDMTAAEKRRLDAALAEIPLDELDVGFGEGEP